MNKARNLGEWQAAMQLRALPNINYIYADQTGNIGFLASGLYPVRADRPDDRAYSASGEYVTTSPVAGVSRPLATYPRLANQMVWRGPLPLERARTLTSSTAMPLAFSRLAKARSGPADQ